MTLFASAMKRFFWILGAILLVAFGTYLTVVDFWSSVTKFPINCQGPEQRANRSNVKVVVAGFAKSGTRTIARALNEIGIQAYHSEDLFLWVYREYASSWYQLNKTMKPPELVQRLYDDPRALTFYASALSRCQVQAVVLDGLEHTTFPTLESNPDATIIKLDWRPYDDYKNSFDTFLPKLRLMALQHLIVGSSLNAPIPWGALLRLIDLLTGRPIENALRTGGPPLCAGGGPMMWMYYHNLIWKHQMRHTSSTAMVPKHESEYVEFFEAVTAKVPKENQLSFNPKKSTYEDLCLFLGISRCPRAGKFAKPVNTFPFEREFRCTSFVIEVVRPFLHWVNWRLCCGLVRACCHLRKKCRRKDCPKHAKLE